MNSKQRRVALRKARRESKVKVVYFDFEAGLKPWPAELLTSKPLPWARKTDLLSRYFDRTGDPTESEEMMPSLIVPRDVKFFHTTATTAEQARRVAIRDIVGSSTNQFDVTKKGIT